MGFLGLILGGIFGIADAILTPLYIGIFLPIRILISLLLGL